MNHSSKPPLSFSPGANGLHGVLRADQIRTDTLMQLVAGWGDEDTRDAIIAALDELAAVVQGVAREGELDAAIEQVEDAAGMDTAQVEVRIPDVRRLLAEIGEVDRVLSRFGSTRPHLKAQPLPEQGDRRWTA
ncbi:hypothetical protein ACFXKC_18155 [Streptomyces sp. NPDC059340]|uniref:hypothetical protein n=1 Tax=Streptomyces sp. NPDC059340 TaxID=3346806 RepID=UPI0036B6D38C